MCFEVVGLSDGGSYVCPCPAAVSRVIEGRLLPPIMEISDVPRFLMYPYRGRLQGGIS